MVVHVATSAARRASRIDLMVALSR